MIMNGVRAELSRLWKRTWRLRKLRASRRMRMRDQQNPRARIEPEHNRTNCASDRAASYICGGRTKAWRPWPLFLPCPGPVWTTSIVSLFGHPFKHTIRSCALFRAGGRLTRKTGGTDAVTSRVLVHSPPQDTPFTMVSILFLSTEGLS